MKAVLLAGGTGSRLAPLTHAVNKHLLPVGGKPMLMHGLSFLQAVQIDDVLIVTTPSAVGSFAQLLQQCPEWNTHVYFATQLQPLGIADALRYARAFCVRESFLVLLADNLLDPANAPSVRKAVDSSYGCHIWTTQPHDVKDYGVLSLDADGAPLDVVEKPTTLVSPHAIVGCYVFDNLVWDVVDNLQRSPRGEYEVTDLIRWYLHNHTLNWHQLTGAWDDLGRSVTSYLEATRNYK